MIAGVVRATVEARNARKQNGGRMATPETIQRLSPLFTVISDTKNLLAVLYEIRNILGRDPDTYFLHPIRQFRTDLEREEWERTHIDLSETPWGDGKMMGLVAAWGHVLRTAQRAFADDRELSGILWAMENASDPNSEPEENGILAMLIFARRPGAVFLRVLEAHLARLEVRPGAIDD
jgi:hypothetical protein